MIVNVFIQTWNYFQNYDTNNKSSRQKIILFLELNRNDCNKVQYIDFHY